MMPFYDLTGPCSCRICGGSLQVKLAVGGKHPGQHYIHCIPCKFHYTFPKTQPAGLATAPPPPSPSEPQEGICVATGCSRASHRVCEQQMCKQCCISHSGCKAPKHNFKYLSDKQKGKIQARLPGSLKAPPSYQHSQTPPNPSPQLERSLSPPTLNFLNNIGNTATAKFLDADMRRQQQEQAERARQVAAEHEEERNYQAAIAASLQVPYVTPGPGPIQSSSRNVAPLPSQPSHFQPAIPSNQAPVETIPYEPNITHHLSPDWMRKTTDNTKKPMKVVRGNPNNRFSVVFWGKTGEAPVIAAVDNCPQWPTWVLMDSLAVKDVLGLGNEHLEFYDTRYSLWVSCSPSYPHDVKKDCRLLLRRRGVICEDFKTHLEHATEKAIHMRLNMAGERTAIRAQLKHRQTARSPSSVIELTDDEIEVEVSKPVHGAKKRARNESEDTRPSQRLRIHSPTMSSPSPPSPVFCLPTTPSARSSLSPPLSFPSSPSSPLRQQKVFVPPTGKWPAGMYTCDMKLAFEQVGSKALKKNYPLLPARIAFVLGREIHTNTWHDQVRLWSKEASESQRNEYSAKGRVKDGSWAAFRKAVRL